MECDLGENWQISIIIEAMKRTLPFVVYLTLLLVSSLRLHAQDGEQRPPATNHTQRGVRSPPPKDKPIRYIYKDSPKKVQLYGNSCAIRITHEMGFEYDIEHKPDTRFLTKWRRFKNNLGVKTKLVFTHGPWWKATINKRLKRCAQYSGDRRG